MRPVRLYIPPMRAQPRANETSPMPSAPETIARHAPDARPVVGLVLGSGLGALADAVEGAAAIPYAELEGFPAAGVSGHAGRLVLGRLGGVEVAVLQGRAHAYEHGDAGVMRTPIAALQAIGARALILTNAAGSLDPAMPPGSLMLIRDHLNLSGLNPLVGETSDARFLAMTGAYDAGIAEAIQAAGEVHEGVYAWMLGPSFETPAEIRMLRTLGADAVGMSTVPEVILARRLGLKAGAVSTITNLGAGLQSAHAAGLQSAHAAGLRSAHAAGLRSAHAAGLRSAHAAGLRSAHAAGLADETLSHAQTKREGEKAADRLIALLTRAMPGIADAARA